MKLIRRIAFSGLLAISMTTLSFAQEDRGAEGASFQGRVSSVDKTAQTVVVDGKTYQLIQTSQIMRNQQAANLNDLAAGDRVAGKYKRSTEDKLEVLKLDIVAKAEPAVANATGAEGTAGAAFSGRVAKTDSASQTVTIGPQTYQVIQTTRITRNGAPATFNDLKSGTPISGRYKKSDSGMLEILTADISGTGNRAVGAAQDNATTGAGASFNGKIGKVNRSEQTIKVEGRTYHILPTTEITHVQGTTISLSDLKEDQRVRGTYRKADNGRLELLSLQVGRPSGS